MDTVTRLNLGCGPRKMAGYVNVDVRASADIQCDLMNFPWPWGDACIDEVYMSHFMEHFRDPVQVMREILRILKPGGKIVVIVPHSRSIYSSMPGWHFTQWGCIGFEELGCSFAGGDWSSGVRTISTSLRFPPWAAKMLPAIGWAFPLMQGIANVRPLYWEFLGLPCVEVEWVGEKKMDGSTRS